MRSEERYQPLVMPDRPAFQFYQVMDRYFECTVRLYPANRDPWKVIPFKDLGEQAGEQQ